MKKSFILHNDSLCVLDDLTMEQRGELFYAIAKYQEGIEIDLSPLVKIAFSPFKNQFNRDLEKYDDFCKLQSQRRKGKKKKPKEPAVNSVTEKTNGTNSDNDSKNESDSKKERKKRYGEYKNVLLKDSEVEKLKDKFGDSYLDKIEEMSEGVEMKGYPYKSHYLAILNWDKRDNKKTTKSTKTQIWT